MIIFIFCLLFIAYCLLSIVYCLLFIVYCLPHKLAQKSTGLLPCLLSIAYCLLPPHLLAQTSSGCLPCLLFPFSFFFRVRSLVFRLAAHLAKQFIGVGNQHSENNFVRAAGVFADGAGGGIVRISELEITFFHSEHHHCRISVAVRCAQPNHIFKDKPGVDVRLHRC